MKTEDPAPPTRLSYKLVSIKGLALSISLSEEYIADLSTLQVHWAQTGSPALITILKTGIFLLEAVWAELQIGFFTAIEQRH